MDCPNCGAEDQAGQFCAECGAQLRSECANCGQDLATGERFCAECGEPAAGAGAPSRTHWWIAAAAALVVVLILMIPQRAERAGPMPMTDPATPAETFGFTGDIRADADRLFNRVMAAAEAGRAAEVEQFLPMALQAYELVDDLDDDGLFHLAILYQTGGEHQMAIARSELILQESPDHVLALGVAGTSAAAMGDRAAAEHYFRRLLDGYETEAARMRPEYVHHEPMLEEYRQIARSFLEQG